MEKATFGGGCFWGVEHAFETMAGIYGTRVGYMGGDERRATYKEVCTGETGHAEVVQLEFKPNEVSYEALLRKFFTIHDPSTLNRQGPDVGTQYRSVIFIHSEVQKNGG